MVDLFHGQLKSCVRCLSCGHTSVRFDPFTYLSLPLPMDSCIHVEVLGMLDNSTSYSTFRQTYRFLAKSKFFNLFPSADASAELNGSHFSVVDVVVVVVVVFVVGIVCQLVITCL